MRIVSLTLILLLSCASCGSNTKESVYEEGMKKMRSSDPAAAIVYFKNALEKDANFYMARFQLAKAYAALGKNAQAEKEFTKVLTQNPSLDEVLLELAKVNTAMGRGEQGADFARKYLAKHPDTGQGLQAVGVALAGMKKYDEALQYLSQARQADPKLESVMLDLALVHLATGKREAARRELDALLQAQPQNLKALYLLASVENEEGSSDKAAVVYQRVLQLDKAQIAAEYKLALLHLEKGDVQKTEAAADRLTREYPKKSEGYRLKGLVCFHRKNYNDAIAQLQQSVKIAPSMEAYYFLGLSYCKKGELEVALSQFRMILDRVPDSSKARLMTAQVLLAQKRTDDAIAEIKKVLALNDGDASAHHLLGSAYMSQGLFDEGIRELNRATRLDPKLAIAHLKKGVFYFGKGREAEGVTELSTAVQVAPDVHNSRLMLASYYHSKGKSSKALSVINEGVTGRKKDAPLLCAMAALNFATGNREQGVRALEQAKKLDPAFPASYHNLAGFYAAAGEYQKAISEFDLLLKQDPTNLRAVLGIAALSEISGNEGDALAYYERGAKSRAPEAFLALAGYHQKKGSYGKAVKVLDEAIRLDPRPVVMLEAKGRILVTQKQYKRAIKTFDELEALDQGRGIALKIAAYTAMGDGAKAVEQARKLISRRPGATQGYLLLASVYRGLGDIPAAIAEAQKAMRADARSVEARLTLGSLHQARKENDKAQSLYQEALILDPDSAPAQFALAALLDQTGKKREAAAKYRTILDRNDTFVPALNNLAYLSADGYGSKEEALRLAVTAFKLQPGDAGIMDTVGYALIKNGRTQDAVKVMERAAALLPNDPSVSYHLGLAYHLAGDRARSEQALRRSLSLGESADSRAAQALLVQLKN